MTISTNVEKALNKNLPSDANSIKKLRITGKQSILGNQATCQIKEPLRSRYFIINY